MLRLSVVPRVANLSLRSVNRPALFHASARMMNEYPTGKNGKPLSAYIAFAKQKRQEILDANPDIKFADIGRKLGEAWKALSESERASLAEKAKEAFEKYKQTKL